MELIQQLVSSLGVNEDQAKGGAGLLFNLAKDKLGSGDFQQLTNAIPGVQDLLGAAPASGGGGLMGSLGGVASSLGGSLGGKMEGLGDLANLAGGFSQLGLSSDMVGKFVPVVLSFVQNQGDDSIKGILEKVLNPSG